MPQLSEAHTTPFVMADTWGKAQVAIDADRRITVDLTGRQYTTDARLVVSAALAKLTIEQAHRLGEALIAASCAASDIEPRQPGLWSETSRRYGWRAA